MLTDNQKYNYMHVKLESVLILLIKGQPKSNVILSTTERSDCISYVFNVTSFIFKIQCIRYFLENVVTYIKGQVIRNFKDII